MWKLLQRKSTVSGLLMPSVGTGRLSSFVRLWRNDKSRPRRQAAMATKNFDDPEATQSSPAELQTPHPLSSQITAPRKRVTAPRQTDEYASRLLLLKAQHEELSAERNQIDQVGQRQRERVADLEARLRFLRHTMDPSAPVDEELDEGERESASVPPIPWSALAPHSNQTPTITFLIPTPGEETMLLPAVVAPRLKGVPTSRAAVISKVAPAQPQPRQTPPPSDAVPEAAYRRALAEAQHWQEQAQELERQIHTLSQMVRVDSLTGLSNRRAFDEHLPRAVARAKRVHDSVCLLMIDIDHFKRLNDTHGHPAGDAVLRSVASSIAGCTRPSDHVARYGGEEFAVVLSDVDSAQAIAVAERIRRQVASADHCPHKVTVSVGVAEYRTSADNLTEGGHDELLAEADRALYAAKHSGRNRVSVSPKCEAATTLPPLR